MVETQAANFESSDMLRVFPTFVWKAQVASGVRQEIEDDVLAKLDEMRRDAGAPAPGHGWQSKQDLHHLDEFQRLVACIHDAAESVLEFLKIGDGAFEITGLWANFNPKAAAHPVHSHPNNFLSGVYYLRTHDGADTHAALVSHRMCTRPGLHHRPVASMKTELVAFEALTAHRARQWRLVPWHGQS